MFNANVTISAIMESRLIDSHMEFGVRLINECAAMFNFSADEAIRALNLSTMKLEKAASKPKKSAGPKEKKPKAAKASFPIPFSGNIIAGCCNGLRFNRGLFTQCTSKAASGFCKSCQAQAEKNANGKPDCGTIADRMCMGLYEFRDPKGKAPIAFTTLLKKLKLSEEAVKEEAGKLSIEIDPEHFDYIEIEKKKGRKASPKKEDENKEKKGKGRPKKSKKVIEIEGESNDLFASLVAQANNGSGSYGNESDSEDIVIEKVTKPKKSVDPEKEALKKAKEEEKAKKEAEKEAKRLAAEAEKARKEEEKAKKEAEKEAKRLAAEAEKARKEAEKKAKEEEKAKKEALKKAKEEEKNKKTTIPAKKESPKKEKAQANDEPDVVKRFEFEGKKYLKSKNTGIIYNMEQDEIGKWNEETQKIDFFENDSDEEVEDAYDDDEEE
jgi:hypothetical protein